MTQQPEGRELHEAVARAMGWTVEMGNVYDGEKWRGTTTRQHAVATSWFEGAGFTRGEGRDMREALGRLVLAVQEREQGK